MSTIILENEKLEKAAKALEKALITLEAYNGPSYSTVCIESAKRTGIFLYDIIADLEDANNQIRACHIMILNEPWMKANSIAQASFEFLNDDGSVGEEKLILKRNRNVRYYKDNEVLYAEHNYEVKGFDDKNKSNFKIVISSHMNENE